MISFGWRNTAGVLLCAWGLMQGVAHWMAWPRVERCCFSLAASPLPMVFRDLGGYEPYAADFELILEHERQRPVRFSLTPARASGLRGPGPRKIMYLGGIVSAPRLPKALLAPALCYGFRGPLLQELSLPFPAATIRLLISSTARQRKDLWTIDFVCPE